MPEQAIAQALPAESILREVLEQQSYLLEDECKYADHLSTRQRSAIIVTGALLGFGLAATSPTSAFSKIISTIGATLIFLGICKIMLPTRWRSILGPQSNLTSGRALKLLYLKSNVIENLLEHSIETTLRIRIDATKAAYKQLRVHNRALRNELRIGIFLSLSGVAFALMAGILDGTMWHGQASPDNQPEGGEYRTENRPVSP